MVDIDELKEYLKKLRKIVDTADFSLFEWKFVKKNRIDDIFCCMIAILPDTFKVAIKEILSLDSLPSVSSYKKLSKTIRMPFFLLQDYYVFDTTEVITLIQAVSKNIERDIRKLEEKAQN